MTAGHPALLYPAGDGPGQVLAVAEAVPRPRTRRAAVDGAARWRAIAATYRRMFDQLTESKETQRA
ncbi:hypothetical protein FHR32_006107 [Streptosporangium album]|uniref:Uncharacterized protein n=1 Tax=Streptosporangium album TaxID=47479 RepID=A0A7W7WCV1_9ACTN|nr:hypothetical protein [Streptosporangium album]MBB4941730.1 hypothetical protein [Streptosporangium album]